MMAPAARREAAAHPEQGHEMREVGVSSKRSGGLFVANNGVLAERGRPIVGAVSAPATG